MSVYVFNVLYGIYKAFEFRNEQCLCKMENGKLIATRFFERSTNEKYFLSKTVIGDKTWIIAYDPETKLQ